MKALLTALGAAALFLTVAPTAVLADHPLTITNNADQSIEYIYISPIDSNNWGSDWLGSAQVLPSGEKMTFTIQSGCLQDIKVVFMDHHSLERRSFDTCKYDLRVNY